jgi:hypothetical protein
MRLPNLDKARNAVTGILRRGNQEKLPALLRMTEVKEDT